MGVISKMLIAEISRMYALIDGEIATMKVRGTGAAEVERLEIGSYTFMPNYLWKM